jgi:signal transduction histidine kinase
LNVYAAILLITALAVLMLAVYSLRFRKSPGTSTFALLLCAIFIYTGGYGFELMADRVETILFWLKIEYLGIAFLPTLIFAMAVNYTGRKRWLKPWIVFTLIAFSLTTIVLQFTNAGRLFYREYALIQTNNLTLSGFTHGAWYWVHQVVTNIMLVFSSLLYIRMIRESSGTNRDRALIMLLSAAVPWAAYLIYLTGNSPDGLDLSPFSFALAGFISALGVFRFQLLEYVPIALEHVFESMTDGVVILDNQFKLVGYNLSASRLYPALTAGIKGETLEIRIAGVPEPEHLFDGYESDAIYRNAKETRYFHNRVVQVFNERGKPMGWTVIFSDVTESRLIEKQLIEKEKKLKELNANKDKFLAIIGHDLRNSFHLIINMSEMLLANIEKENTEAAMKKGKIIYDTSITTYTLLQNLLEWALIQQKGMHFKPVKSDLNQLIEEELRYQRIMAEQKDLRLNRVPGQDMILKADREMLKTILRNLISNAIKYSFPGGTIDISHTNGTDVAVISVRDHGTGMTEEEQKKLFVGESSLSKRGTAKETGTGLGLRLCAEFVHLHGGSIWVESGPGKGSEFCFTIPLWK